MDSLDLLAREDEFKKLNKQLEKKTESLMKEIEFVMQKQDIFTEFSSNLTLSPAHSIKKHCCAAAKPLPTPPQLNTNKKKQKTKPTVQFENGTTELAFGTQNPANLNNTNGNFKFENGTDNSANNENGTVEFENGTNNSSGSLQFENGSQRRVACDCCNNRSTRIGSDLEFLYAFVSLNVKEKVLPQSFLKDHRVTVENVCKFLSSKVNLMQEQIDRLQNTMDKKASQCDSHLTQLAELESQRMALLNKSNNMKASTVEMKAKCMALQARLDEKDRLYKEQRSESDKLSSELKRIKSRNAAIEARCASQEETIDNLRQQNEATKMAEKELRDSSRTLSASHQTAISRLEAQIKALTTRVDKQMALIDNLRRQNVLLSTEGALKVLEKEYSDFLNQDFN